MSSTDNLTPLERAALREALQSPTRSLVRTAAGYVSARRRSRSGETLPAPAFTSRVMNRLDRRALVDFDPPHFPERVVLTKHGLAVAEQVTTEDAARGGPR